MIRYSSQIGVKVLIVLVQEKPPFGKIFFTSTISEGYGTSPLNVKNDNRRFTYIPMSPLPKDQVPLSIYYQNIRGLRGKVNQLICQLYPSLPHILCLSEHHMTDCELQTTYLGNYKLGSSYCRRMYEMGGVCIYIQENLKYVCLNLEAKIKPSKSALLKLI